MARLTIRNVPEATMEALRHRAAEQCVSLEDCVRQILQSAAESHPPEEPNIVEMADRYFGPFGGVDLELPPRKSNRDISDFGDQ